MSKQDLVRRYLIFHGRVQGVGFRYVSMCAAQSCGATGWVRNEYEGTVQLELQGTELQLEQVLRQLNNATYISISRIDSSSIPVISQEDSFRVKY